jgi:hypothetical protein
LNSSRDADALVGTPDELWARGFFLEVFTIAALIIFSRRIRDIFKMNVHLLGSGSRYDPVTVRVGDQLVWVTLDGRVPLLTNYAPSSEDILGMKG